MGGRALVDRVAVLVVVALVLLSPLVYDLAGSLSQ